MRTQYSHSFIAPKLSSITLVEIKYTCAVCMQCHTIFLLPINRPHRAYGAKICINLNLYHIVYLLSNMYEKHIVVCAVFQCVYVCLCVNTKSAFILLNNMQNYSEKIFEEYRRKAKFIYIVCIVSDELTFIFRQLSTLSAALIHIICM